MKYSYDYRHMSVYEAGELEVIRKFVEGINFMGEDAFSRLAGLVQKNPDVQFNVVAGQFISLLDCKTSVDTINDD